MSKFSETIDNVVNTLKDVTTFVLGAPVALKAGGGFLQGISKTIANPKASSAIAKAGKFVSTAGNVIGKYIAAGTKGAVKALKPGITATLKSLPLSKYIAPAVKYVPYAAMATGLAMGATQLVKSAGQVRSMTGSAPIRASSERSSFNPLDLQSWIELGKRTVTFK